MNRFCVAVSASMIEEFQASNQATFIAGISVALRRMRERQNPWNRRMGLDLMAWDGDGWVHVRNRRARAIGVTEQLLFADPKGLWECSSRTARGSSHMNEQINHLVEFVRMTPSEALAYRRQRLTLIQGGKQ